MTFSDLEAECWDALPPIRKRLAGRDSVRQMLADAVCEMDVDAIAACRGDADLGAYQDALLERIRKRQMGQEYGFVFLSIILTAVLVAVIQWLVKRWLDNHFSLTAMRQELAS